MQLQWSIITAQRRCRDVCGVLFLFIWLGVFLLLFCGTSVHMPTEDIKNSSHICPQTMGRQRSQASSHASPLSVSSQLTDREETIPACVCLSAYLSAPPPPPPPRHRRSPPPPPPPLRRCGSEDRLPRTAGSPPPASLTGCARRRSWRRWTSGSWWSPSDPLSLQALWERRENEGGVKEKKKTRKNFWSAWVGALVVKFDCLDRTAAFFFCREIRCVIATGPSHQPVSARPVHRVWVLKPITVAANQMNNIRFLTGFFFPNANTATLSSRGV